MVFSILIQKVLLLKKQILRFTKMYLVTMNKIQECTVFLHMVTKKNCNKQRNFLQVVNLMINALLGVFSQKITHDKIKKDANL